MELGKGPIDWLQLFKFAKKNLSVISEFNIEDLPRLNEIARNNSDKIKSVSVQMIEQYVPMVRKALEEIRPLYNDSKEFQEVFENAKLYIDDAENFLKQGKDENAVLSIGYADGLVDALRIAKGIDPKI